MISTVDSATLKRRRKLTPTAINSLRRYVTWHSNGLCSERVRIPTGRQRTDPHIETNGSRGTWKYNIYVDGCLRNNIVIMQSHTLVNEHRHSLFLPRVQLCVRESCALRLWRHCGWWCAIMAQHLCSDL